jgi:hypothetical protein
MNGESSSAILAVPMLEKIWTVGSLIITILYVLTTHRLLAPRTNTFVGTAAYISPEILARSETNPQR